MPCASCQQARQSSIATIKAITTGNLSEAKREASTAAQIVTDKLAESLRVRGLLRR